MAREISLKLRNVGMGADQRSVLLHQSHNEEMGQFDRFVLGATLAGCAYLGQTIPFGHLGWNISTMFLCSLLILGLSAYLGFKRIEAVLRARRANSDFLHAQETSDHAKAVIVIPELRHVARLTEIYYQLRNMTLLLGFTGYIAAKVLCTYV
jgi:hypothetical protein